MAPELNNSRHSIANNNYNLNGNFLKHNISTSCDTLISHKTNSSSDSRLNDGSKDGENIANGTVGCDHDASLENYNANPRNNSSLGMAQSLNLTSCLKDVKLGWQNGSKMKTCNEKLTDLIDDEEVESTQGISVKGNLSSVIYKCETEKQDRGTLLGNDSFSDNCDNNDRPLSLVPSKSSLEDGIYKRKTSNNAASTTIEDIDAGIKDKG